jgi:hypothetical protein
VDIVMSKPFTMAGLQTTLARFRQAQSKGSFPAR